jgi:hypothetical protein
MCSRNETLRPLTSAHLVRHSGYALTEPEAAGVLRLLSDSRP